ncbi:MAG: PAS domain S-box protein [Myxococcales bacterium]|nr:PAS domain S-box protein [Myxococcales bacterium]
MMLVIEDVTARDRLERSSRESQTRFEQAFHGNAAAMVIAHQSDLRIIDVNPRWLEMFGATRAQVIGRTSVELGLISEARAQIRVEQHRKFVDGYETELELCTMAGAPLTVFASAKPIVIAEGLCTLTTLIDLTGRKLAEEAFAAAFNASPAGMLLVDATSERVIAVNRRMLEMTRSTREEIVGYPIADLQLSQTPPRAELMAEMERAGKLVGVEIQLTCKGGPGVWTLASAEVVTLHGRPYRLSVFTEITARKRVERRLLTQHLIGHSLAEASDLETAIPRVLEALGRGEGWDVTALWLRATDTDALRCSWTWSAESVVAVDAHGRSEVIAASGVIERVSASGAPERLTLGPLGHAIAFPILRGTTVLGVLTLAADGVDLEHDPADLGLFDTVGRMLGLFIARTRAEVAARELNVELERRVLERTHALETSNRDLEAFSSSVSHDLRAPLRAIHGFSRILLDDFAAELPSEAKDLLGRIHAGESRLRRLIDDLLEFARVGRAVLHRRPVDLDALVRSVIDELLVGRPLGDRLELRLAPLGSCHADPSLVRAVWTNLLDNALKYARNRERIVIAVGCDDGDDGPVYHVTDNGVGFDIRHAGRLFGVFQRLHTEQEFEGTGIGLANVRRIIEHHQGRITATSEPGRGTRFEFTLGDRPAANTRIAVIDVQ